MLVCYRFPIIFAGLLTALLCLTPNAQAFSLHEAIAQQSVSTLSVYGYVGISIVSVLSIFIFFLLAQKAKYVKQTQQQHAQAEAQINNLPTGIIHINQQGCIVYSNLTAAKLFRRDLQKLVNTELYSHFVDAEDELSSDCVAKIVECDGLQLQAKVSKLFVMIKSNGQIYNTGATVLTVENQHHLTTALQQSKQLVAYQTKVLNALAFATIIIDLNDKTYCYDATGASLLHLDVIAPGSRLSAPQAMQLFENKIHNADFSAWRKALHSVSATATINCRIATHAANTPKTYLPVNMTITPGQTKAQLEIYLRTDYDYEALKHQTDTINHQQQTLLNATEGPAYSTDDKGNVLWSNSAFMQLVRSVNPANTSTNIFTMGIFPEDVIAMHHSPSGVTHKSYTATFNVAYSDGEVHRVKINLAFYLHKHRLTDQSVIGMVGVINV